MGTVYDLRLFRKTGSLELSIPLGERIAIARKNQGMTQEEVAMKVACDRSVVSKWECGKLPVQPADLAKLSEVLHAPDLLGYFCNECPVCKAVVKMQPKPAA